MWKKAVMYSCKAAENDRTYRNEAFSLAHYLLFVIDVSAQIIGSILKSQAVQE
jgi:hypothetical protein